MNAAFWSGRRVLLTGHTGFKGAWLALMLRRLGAEVCGFALPPPTTPSLYALAAVSDALSAVEGDVRDLDHLCRTMANFEPEVVLHLAAQSVVLEAYRDPVATFSSNVLGTVHLLEAVRRCGRPMAVVNVTTDKVYRPDAQDGPFAEGAPLGGIDPYAASKVGAEWAGEAYAHAFFGPLTDDRTRRTALASARAGNVLGGGDYTPHQLVPAVVAAALAGRPAELRHPLAVRPWQHVLDALNGYLTLAEALATRPTEATGAWNFGPADGRPVTVAELATALARHWGIEPAWRQVPAPAEHEQAVLRIDSRKARERLGWRCLLDTATTIDWVADWHRRVADGAAPRAVCAAQIDAFLEHRADAGRPGSRP